MSLNWQAMVTLVLDQASQSVRAGESLSLTSSPPTHTLARSTWSHFEHSPCLLLKSPLSAPQVWAHWRPGACRSRSSVPSCATLCSTLCATHGRKSCRCPELQLPLKRRAGASKPQVSPPSNRMEPALVSPPWIKPTMDQTHHGTSPPWIKPTFKTCKAGDVKAPLIYL